MGRGGGGICSSFSEGFNAIKLLDNSNVYAVLYSETFSNIFISSLWQKVLNPYTLVVSGGDKMVVGNNITVSGLTRAFVGVIAGQTLIDRLGVDSTFVIAGILGFIGIAVNIYVLSHSSVEAIYWLNIVWAVFSGLWNSCMETEWARSLLKSKREDANGGRQVLNKLTGTLGPLFSIAMFLYVGGTTWTVPVLTTVMTAGTILTIIPVVLCFTFSRWFEVHQTINLNEIAKIEFPNKPPLQVDHLTKDHFNTKAMDGPVRLTYPLGPDSQYGKLRVLTPALRETNYMLGKQVMATLLREPVSRERRKLEKSEMLQQFSVGSGGREVEVKNSRPTFGRSFTQKMEESTVDLLEPCILHYHDRARSSQSAQLENIVIYLQQDRSVDTETSWMSFSLVPNLAKNKKFLKSYFWIRGFRKVFYHRSNKVSQTDLDELSAELLPEREARSSTMGSGSGAAFEAEESRGKVKETKPAKVNMNMANSIVFCDVLNAIGSGMSLKFMDLFLIEDYGITPVMLLSVAILQNLAVVFLTPTVKTLMKKMRKRGMKGALVVSLVWAVSLFFLGLICVPNQNFYISVVSIILMNSLSSCTKAYNRAKLVDSLPPSRIANYMVWDSLNKANQGGIAVFGGQIAHWGGYRACFMVTFLILAFRWVVWTGYLLSRGCSRKVKVHPRDTEIISEYDPRDDKWDTSDAADFDGGEVASELFVRRSISNLAGDQDVRYTIGQAPTNIMVAIDEEEDEGPSGAETAPIRQRFTSPTTVSAQIE